jgi:PPIC-type PPIASE domain
MHKSWLLCAFLGVLAWGQTQPAAPPAQASPAPAANAAAKPEAAPAKEVALSEPVLTIKGVSCPEFAKTAPVPTAAAGKTATAAKRTAECKITRAEFERLSKALQQGPNPLNAQQKRQLATQLPGFIAMSEAAKKKGLDKSDSFQETMKFVKIRILAQKLQENARLSADNVPETEIAAYYKANPEAFEQFSLDRLYVPRDKQPPEEDKDEAAKEPEKLTEEQQKAKDEAEKAKQEKNEQELKELAETLRQRAAAGEDFAKLEKEALDAAGVKAENSTINLPTVRRTGLPPAHVAVFDLKVGEVSAVINEPAGHYIYKVVSKEVLPLDDKITAEIRNKLKAEHFKEAMDKYTNSYQTVTNEEYFGSAPAGPLPRIRPQMPMTPRSRPQGAARPVAPATGAPAPSPSTQSPSTQSPSTQPPASAPPAKPN